MVWHLLRGLRVGSVTPTVDQMGVVILHQWQAHSSRLARRPESQDRLPACYRDGDACAAFVRRDR